MMRSSGSVQRRRRGRLLWREHSAVGGYGGVGADGADTDHKSAGEGGDGRAQREKKVLDTQTWGSTARRNEESERAGG